MSFNPHGSKQLHERAQTTIASAERILGADR